MESEVVPITDKKADEVRRIVGHLSEALLATLRPARIPPQPESGGPSPLQVISRRSA